MDKFKNIFQNDAEQQGTSEESGIIDDLWKNSSLSWSSRIKGFICMFVVGLLCSILGTILLWVLGSFTGFAVLYSIGNLASIGSTCFLMGPVSQLKKMFAPTRLIATILMLLFIGLTLCAAFWWENFGLVLLFIILQFLAMIWYSISYIPFARDLVKKFVGGAVGM